MRILSHYVAREYLKLFGFLLLAFVSIYTLFDFIEKVDNFTEASVPGSTMLAYFILQVPELISLLAPLAVLMATVITLGMMSKRGEVVAVKSSGISIFRYTLPIVLFATSLAFGLALLNETVIPQTKTRTNYIWEVLVEKRPGKLYQEGTSWFKGQNSIYHVGHYEPSDQSLNEVTYYRMDKDYNLVLRVDAAKAEYTGGKWLFINGLVQRRLPKGGYTAQVFDQMEFALPEGPEHFTQLAKPSDEMSLGELAAYVRKAKREGFTTRRQEVDLHTKISYPFVCVIMALLGIPLALMQEGGRALALGIILGLASALVYWIVFSYVRSIFGYGGIVPPIVAAWLPNAVFGLAGLGLLTSIRQ